ncbi:long-chain fatty acid--CoA ligase [Pseudaminobacter arsenicus]|uniref:Long-chain fatty acid--CoA ligase n=1 Tax=Borborobacter arsenicus TaxID=1851146 RepID=A0A432V848_9HYPH|nr:class I adenylate-forming enzyme family protein [Pseudaminobacter arsenicus]RUM98329.1 long-chain fatty acid--CoA ligase [Pseudaminobacter arsenicus]
MAASVVQSASLRRRNGAATAISSRGKSYSVAEILKAAKALAQQFSQVRQNLAARIGLNPPCVLLPSSQPAAFLAALIAARMEGFISVPWRDAVIPPDAIADAVRPDLKLHFDEGVIDRCSVKMLDSDAFIGERHGDIIMMTSGSTGQPKGVALVLDQILLNALSAGAVMEIWKCTGWAIDIDVGLMSGLNHLLMAWQFDLPCHHLSAGGDDIYETTFSTGAVGFGGSPIQLVRMGNRLDSSCPVMMVSSGDFLMPSMIDQVLERFPDTLVHKLYGLTELGGRFCCMPHQFLLGRKESAGLPLPGFRARVSAETGVIEARSPLLTAGYYLPGGDFSPMKDGWFSTGDVGSIDADGVVTLNGRSNDVFKVGGEKVDRHTIEVELAPLLPAIDYCVLAVEHRLLGQCAALFVVDSGSGDLPKWAEIVAHLRSRLHPRFIPSLMYKVEGALPRLASGKIDRESLRSSHLSFQRLQ